MAGNYLLNDWKTVEWELSIDANHKAFVPWFDDLMKNTKIIRA
jgi:hypothetical protein